MGIEDDVVEQALPLVYACLPRRMLSSQVYVESYEAAPQQPRYAPRLPRLVSQ
jgi:hypothetical protein